MKYYVAYVDKQGQLNVDFYDSLIDYNEAVNDAEERHSTGEYDTYIHSDVPVK